MSAHFKLQHEEGMSFPPSGNISEHTMHVV